MSCPCSDSQLDRRRISFAGRTWCAVAHPDFADFRPPELAWGDTEQMKQHPDAAKIQHHREVIRLRREDGDLFIKHYMFHGFFRRLKRTLGGGRARQEFRTGRECLARGIRTGEPVWTAVRRAGGLIAESFLVTRAVPGAPVETYYDGLAEADRPAFLAAVGKEVARFHDIGFYHDDLKGWHLLVAGVGAEVSFAVIDLHGCRFRFRLSRRQRANNLYQVFRSLDRRADADAQGMILAAYHEHGGLDARPITTETIAAVARSKAARRGPGALRPQTE